MKTAAEMEAFDAAWVARLPERPEVAICPRPYDFSQGGWPDIPGLRERVCGRCGDAVFVSPAVLTDMLTISDWLIACRPCACELMNITPEENRRVGQTENLAIEAARYGGD
jgi:hypothetical protein